MSICIEAMYEGGVLKPLDHNHLKEHTRYRLMLVDEIQTTDLTPRQSITTILSERTTILAHGQTTINVFGIFHHEGIDLAYNTIETTLNDLHQEHMNEWTKES